MKTLILTGATGFTGRFLVEEALKRNYKVITLVRKSSNLNFLNNRNIDIITADLSNKESLTQGLKKLKNKIGPPDLIIHNAGLTKALRQKDYIANNEGTTRNLISALKESALIPKKFIYTSSLAALGPGNATTLTPITENTPPKPITFYGKSKLQAETLITNIPDFPWIIIRPTAVYGPGDGDGLTLYKSIKIGIEAAVAKTTQHLSFIYVADMAKAYFEIAEKSASKEAYNLSDGNFYTQSQLNAYIKAAMGKKGIKININPAFLKILAFGAELRSLITGKISILTRNKVNELQEINWKVDATKIKEKIGFHAETDLESGIHKTFKWYKIHGWI